jgi:L-arabinonolactonase
MSVRLLQTIPVRNTLGESILWDERTQRVWWTDIQEAVLFRYALAGGVLERFELPERLCSFGFVERDVRLVGAFASGFALFEPGRGELEWLYRPELEYRGTRFNDGRVDPAGRFWAGTMVEGDARDAASLPVRGSLYWVGNGSRGRALRDIGISNSLCFSPDGKTLYFADSPTRQIMAYALDPVTGELGAGRVFARTEGQGVPDGSAVDAEGCLWNAEWGGARVVRYAPDGRIDRVLELPVSQPTCVCFGGRDLNVLFVSTAREGLGPERLEAEPEAGNVFVYATGWKGLPTTCFRA